MEAQKEERRPLRLRPIKDIHIDELLEIVVEKGATDLHIAVGLPPILRVDGRLVRLPYEPFTPEVTQRMIYDILTDEQIREFEEMWDIDFAYSLKRKARFRVNVFKDKGNVAAAFRLIPMRPPTIDELGLPEVLKEICRRPRGLVLATGPTGSGKTTTLAAMINQINMERAVHIVTIEDPIEYVHPHKKAIIQQREVGHDVQSFARGIRAALREDPDVILVGEMRDLETMQTAITAAETGHLVFATLHTRNAAESIDRIIDAFPVEQQEQIRVQLSNNLVAIISQNLLPRATGVGRVAICEIMIATPAIRNLIRENKTYQIPSIIQTSGELGMQTFDQALADYYVRGIINYEDALSMAQEPEEFKRMVEMKREAMGAGGPPVGGGK